MMGDSIVVPGGSGRAGLLPPLFLKTARRLPGRGNADQKWKMFPPVLRAGKLLRAGSRAVLFNGRPDRGGLIEIAGMTLKG